MVHRMPKDVHCCDQKRQNNERIRITKLDEAFFGHFRRVEIDKLTISELWQPSNGASGRQIVTLTLYISTVILQLFRFCKLPRMEKSALYQYPAENYNEAKRRSFTVKLPAANHNDEPGPAITFHKAEYDHCI